MVVKRRMDSRMHRFPRILQDIGHLESAFLLPCKTNKKGGRERETLTNDHLLPTGNWFSFSSFFAHQLFFLIILTENLAVSAQNICVKGTNMRENI